MGNRMILMGMVSGTREKRFGKSSIIPKKPINMQHTKMNRRALKGRQRRINKIKPANPVKITASVEVCSVESCNQIDKGIKRKILNIIINDPGKDLLIMLIINFP